MEKNVNKYFATEGLCDPYFPVLHEIIPRWLFNGVFYKHRYNVSPILFLFPSDFISAKQ